MNRIRQLRLAKGLSLEALAQSMGGVVTKQALSKYEKGLAKPTATVAVRLAASLGVKTLQLWEEPSIKVELVAYRCRVRLGQKERARIEALATKTLEDRCRLQAKLGLESRLENIIAQYQIKNLEEAEQAAVYIRQEWNLGADALHDVTGILEDRLIHVIELDAEKEFDGISATARNEENRIIASAVTSRREVAGERQRMNLAHELGHLVLKPLKGCDEEKAAFRFAGSFLLPKESLTREIGERRSNIHLPELLALKKRFKLSLQAILYRMLDLNIISVSLYKQWQIIISQQGWRKEEPEPLKPERSDWLRRMLSRAMAEGIITSEEAQHMSGNIFQVDELSAPTTQAKFLRMPLEKRRKLLQAQAEHIQNYYENAREDLDLETGEGW
jgi:Zn-dependent peptidase ImmA (M78 family)/DNA-binding XRE family transcriptional regulator